MGRLIIILILGSISIYGVVSINTNKSTTDAARNAADYYKDVNARNIANSMIQMLQNKLSDSTSYRVSSPLEKSMFDGNATYRVVDTVLVSDTLIKIDVTGNYLGISKNVIALIRLNSVTAPEVPPFFKYSLLGGTEVKINGNNSTVKDDNNPSINANIHSNGNVVLDGNSMLIKGFATYTGSITANWSQVTITPNQNPLGLPTRYSSPSVDIPIFNPDDHLSKATQIFYGDKTYSGNVTLGTKENPAIIYISGKMFIQGTFSGYGIFIVKDDVEATDHVLVAAPVPPTSSIAIYTAKKFIANTAGRHIHAQVFANDDVILNNNNIEFYGSITSQTKVILNGNYANINYKPASGDLTNPFWPTTPIEVAKRPVLVHYFE